MSKKVEKEQKINKKINIENGNGHSNEDSHLIVKTEEEKEEKEEEVKEEDEEDDIPLSELIKKNKSIKSSSTNSTHSTTKTTSKTTTNTKGPSKGPSKGPETVSDDSEDDVPISVLIKRKKEEIANIEIQTKTKNKIEKKIKTKNSTKEIKNESNNLTAKASRASEKKNASSEPSDAFYRSKKGKLVQKLLIRWWYALSWPEEEAINSIPEGGYEPLDGFPGVFICTNVCYSISLYLSLLKSNKEVN